MSYSSGEQYHLDVYPVGATGHKLLQQCTDVLQVRGDAQLAGKG